MISAILSDYNVALLLNGFDETSVHFVNIQSAAVYLLIAFLFFFLDVLYVSVTSLHLLLIHVKCRTEALVAGGA